MDGQRLELNLQTSVLSNSRVKRELNLIMLQLTVCYIVSGSHCSVVQSSSANPAISMSLELKNSSRDDHRQGVRCGGPSLTIKVKIPVCKPMSPTVTKCLASPS